MGDLVKYGLLALGGYMLYEYFYGTPVAAGITVIPPISAGTTQPGTTGSGITTTPPIVSLTSTPAQPQVSTPPPTQAQVDASMALAKKLLNLETQLNQLANTYTNQNQGASLNLWNWMYFYNQITGTSLFGTAQGEQMVQFLGLTDATASSTPIPMPVFMTALNSVGLSGLGFIRGLRGLGLI